MRKLKDKFKEFFNDTYGMLIVVSWILLIVCLIIKLFGGNWFELSSDNNKFLSFCNFVDDKLWLKMILGCLIAILTTYPIYCIMINEKVLSKRNFLILIPLLVIKCIIGWYNPIISFIIDLFILLIVITVLNKNFKRTIVCFVIINALQILTLVLRNLSFDFNVSNTFVEQTLYQVDYYIMIILFYLYNFRKKDKENK